MLSHLEIHELACSWSFLWRWRAIFSRPACCFSWLFRWVTPSIHVDPWAVDAGTSYPNNNFSTLACVSVFDVPNGWTWWCPMWVSRWSNLRERSNGFGQQHRSVSQRERRDRSTITSWEMKAAMTALYSEGRSRQTAGIWHRLLPRVFL